jgi:hypothetical protein
MPRWLIVLVIAIVWAALQLGMRLLIGKEVEAENVAATAALGVALGILTLWWARRAQAKERNLPPGSPTGTNITKAMSTGQLPEQASAQEWEAELIWMLIQDRHMVWVGPLICGLFSAMGVFLAFGKPEHPWFGVVFAVAFLGMAIWFPVWVRRRRVRIQKLLAQLPVEESSRQ